MHYITGHIINFDISECHTNRLFCNKIWQATKFTKMWFKNVSESQNLPVVELHQLAVMDKWILSRLSDFVNAANTALESYDLNKGVCAIKNFLYNDFCDVYLVSDSRFKPFYETYCHLFFQLIFSVV